MEPEQVFFQTANLQRAAKPTPPVFIFGTWLGTLLLTSRRVLFLSTGGMGASYALSGGVFEEKARLSEPGALAIPHAALFSASRHRRWDFGNYLRITYRGDNGDEAATSFIFAGPVLGAAWIDEWVKRLKPFTQSMSSGGRAG